MPTVSSQPKLEEKASACAPDLRDGNGGAEKTMVIVDRPPGEWKEAAADRIVQGADWLAGATSRLSDRISTAAHNEKARENAIKAVSVVTGAGALIAQQAVRIKPIKTYKATAQYARSHPRTAIVGGLVAAAAIYGIYRSYQNAKQAEQQSEAEPVYS
jgi:hypothetical protein